MHVELKTHLVELAEQNRITIKWLPWELDQSHIEDIENRYHAKWQERAVHIPEVETHLAYFIGLHEIGHVITPPPAPTPIAMIYEGLLGYISPERLVGECFATAWAYMHALCWDQSMADEAIRSLDTYSQRTPGDTRLGLLSLLAADGIKSRLTGEYRELKKRPECAA